MATTKITDLTAYTDPVNTDVLPIVDVTSDVTKKVSIANVMKNASQGTAAAPGIAFDGDSNTGIYSPGANQVAITTDGTQRLLIDSAGAVTIAGDLTVNGTTTNINTTNLIVEDKNIVLGDVAVPTDVTADGGGITLKGTTDKTINWVDSTDAWTSSERFSYPTGSAAAPTLTFTGDPNTGIYSPGADQVAISTGGSGRLFVDASGRIGVAGSPSASATTYLQVGNAGIGSDHIAYNYDSYFANNLYKSGSNAWNRISARGGGLLRVDDDVLTYSTANSGTAGASATLSERLRITSAGLVGVGTSSPVGKLAVGNSSNNFLVSIDSSASYAEIQAYNAPLYINRQGNNTILNLGGGSVGIGTSSPGSYTEAPNLVVANTSGNCGATIASSASGYGALYFADGTTGDEKYRGGFTYYHNYAGIVDQMRFTVAGSGVMAIDSSGRVGIGTTSPTSTLSVGGNAPQAGAIGAVCSAGGIALSLSDNVNSSLHVRTANGGAIIGTDAGGVLRFATNGVATTDERMRIDSSGRLLVGTSTATAAGELLRVEKASTGTEGTGIRFGGTYSLADGATQSFTVGNGALVFISENNTGDGALFFCGYRSATVTLLSDPNNRYANSDTAAKICVFKSANTGTVSLKNRSGSTGSFTIGKVNNSD